MSSIPTVYLAADERMIMHCCTDLNHNGIHTTSLLDRNGMSEPITSRRYQLWQDNNHCVHFPCHEENPTLYLPSITDFWREDRLLAQVYPGMMATVQSEESISFLSAQLSKL